MTDKNQPRHDADDSETKRDKATDSDKAAATIDRSIAERFAIALGHHVGPWEQRRMFMEDLFLTDDQVDQTDLPRVWVMSCLRCGAQLPDLQILARRSAMLTDWCPWLLILMPERRAAAAAAYREWCRTLHMPPGSWAGGDDPIPGCGDDEGWL